jgi:hypothetical protein
VLMNLEGEQRDGFLCRVLSRFRCYQAIAAAVEEGSRKGVRPWRVGGSSNW